MNTAIGEIGKCGEIRSRRYFTPDFFRFTRPKPDNRTKLCNFILQRPARFAVESRQSTRFSRISGVKTTLLFVGKFPRTGRNSVLHPSAFFVSLFRLRSYGLDINSIRRIHIKKAADK